MSVFNVCRPPTEITLYMRSCTRTKTFRVNPTHLLCRNPRVTKPILQHDAALFACVWTTKTNSYVRHCDSQAAIDTLAVAVHVSCIVRVCLRCQSPSQSPPASAWNSSRAPPIWYKVITRVFAHGRVSHTHTHTHTHTTGDNAEPVCMVIHRA